MSWNKIETKHTKILKYGLSDKLKAFNFAFKHINWY